MSESASRQMTHSSSYESSSLLLAVDGGEGAALSSLFDMVASLLVAMQSVGYGYVTEANFWMIGNA